MLKQAKDKRTLKDNLRLASSTAFVAGMTNVAGIVAFLAFTSNVTGHVATLAKHVVERNMQEIIVFFIWLLMFLMGAFSANFIIKSLAHKNRYFAHAQPVILEIIIMLLIATYGHNFYENSRLEREILIGATLFTMGLQNSMVSVISGGLIKTSHLSGLFTDFGGELAEWFHPKSEKQEAVKHKLYIRLTILSFYFVGGIFGGYFFNQYAFGLFFFIPVILLTILLYDLQPMLKRKIKRLFSSYNFNQKTSNIHLKK